MSITTDNSTLQIVGSVENIDPKALQFEDNVRDQVDLDKDFLASLREHGVIVPILAVRNAEGNILVREGQCRTLGAREVGLATVPVYVLPADATDADTDTDTATVERIVQQMVANDQRHGLTNSQRARAIQQMLDTGMSATRVAKKLSMPREAVSAAGAASKSAAAMSALDEGQLDFGQAEVLAEFEEDADAVERLLRAARYGGQQFEHTVSTLRTRRSLDALYAETEKPYAEAGFTILQDRPSWSDPAAVAMEYLRTADGADVPEDCEKKPEHWAVVLTEDYAYVDPESGEPVDPADLDDATEYDEDAEAAEGLRHYSSVTEKTVLVPEWFCLNTDAAGFEIIESVREAHNRRRSHDATAAEVGSPEAIAEREAQRQEEDRRERRKVLVLNRLGDAAQVVRRDFVTKLLARKTAPKGAATFVAHCLTRDPYILTQNHGSGLTAELLGVGDERGVRVLVNDLSTNIDARAQVITLAVVLGALEARTDKSAWRNARSGITGTASYIASTVGSDAYLHFLVDCGYEPSAVEKVIVGQASSEGVYDDAVKEAAEED